MRLLVFGFSAIALGLFCGCIGEFIAAIVTDSP